MKTKKTLSHIILSLFFLITLNACDKSKDPVSVPDPVDSTAVRSAEFSSDLDAIYLFGNITFTAKDTLGNQNYYWNFGDGFSISAGYRVNHLFRTSGIHKVSLSVDSLAYEKEIVVFPGSISYQIWNESNVDLNIYSYVSNPDDYGSVSFKLNARDATDTIYSNSISQGAYGFDMLSIHIFVDTIEYVNYDLIWLTSMQHNISTLNDSSMFIKMHNTGANPPDTIILKNLISPAKY